MFKNIHIQTNVFQFALHLFTLEYDTWYPDNIKIKWNINWGNIVLNNNVFLDIERSLLSYGNIYKNNFSTHIKDNKLNHYYHCKSNYKKDTIKSVIYSQLFRFAVIIDENIYLKHKKLFLDNIKLRGWSPYIIRKAPKPDYNKRLLYLTSIIEKLDNGRITLIKEMKSLLSYIGKTIDKSDINEEPLSKPTLIDINFVNIYNNQIDYNNGKLYHLIKKFNNKLNEYRNNYNNSNKDKNKKLLNINLVSKAEFKLINYFGRIID